VVTCLDLNHMSLRVWVLGSMGFRCEIRHELRVSLGHEFGA
jgi:hypothetical protein